MIAAIAMVCMPMRAKSFFRMFETAVGSTPLETLTNPSSPVPTPKELRSLLVPTIPLKKTPFNRPETVTVLEIMVLFPGLK